MVDQAVRWVCDLPVLLYGIVSQYSRLPQPCKDLFWSRCFSPNVRFLFAGIVFSQPRLLEKAGRVTAVHCPEGALNDLLH
jgi:hypothetical protein